MDLFEDYKVYVRIDPERKIHVFEPDQLLNEIVKNGSKNSYHEVMVSKYIRFNCDVDKLPPGIVDPVSFIR
jgi:hypothetical protein